MFQPWHHAIAKRPSSVHHNKIRAVVVKNEHHDEKYQNKGLIKIRCRDIHDNFPDEHLPYALPEEGFSHGGPGQGVKDIPPVGSTVFITHQDGSLYHPQYSHGPSTDDRPIKELGPNKPGKVDRSGNLTMVNHDEGKNIITETHQSGTTKEIDTDGNVIEQMVKKMIMKIFGDDGAEFHSAKKMLFNCKDITFTADTLKFKVGSLTGPQMQPDSGNYNDIGEAPEARDKPKLNDPAGMTKY